MGADPCCLFRGQGSASEALAARKREEKKMERLNAEAAEVKQRLAENGGKQRDVSSSPLSVSTGVS